MSPLPSSPPPGLRLRALEALLEPDPARKAEMARALFEQAGPSEAPAAAPPLLTESERLQALHLSEAQQAAMPGRPDLPRLVPAKDVPSRSPFTLEGRAALLHAICHIEFNAIKNVFLVSKLPIHPLKWTIGR